MTLGSIVMRTIPYPNRRDEKRTQGVNGTQADLEAILKFGIVKLETVTTLGEGFAFT